MLLIVYGNYVDFKGKMTPVAPETGQMYMSI